MRPLEMSDLMEAAYLVLHDEMGEALRTDPRQVVQAPAFSKRDWTAADIVLDSFFGLNGLEMLAELLRITAQAAAGDTPNALSARAKAWIDAQACSHADHHRDDLVDQLERSL